MAHPTSSQSSDGGGAQRRPFLVGVTGGIGSGKSEVAAHLGRLGAHVFSADAAVHDLYANDPDVRSSVLERWGEQILREDGSIDRSAIANLVFASPAELAWLEGLLHPLVGREWLRFVHQHESDPHAVLVAEVPLLFEGDLDDRYDATITVSAPLEQRLVRVGERATGSSHAGARAALQLTDDERSSRATHTITNDGSLAQLHARVAEIFASFAR